ncbi:MAG: S1 RNA-binding domain-containing protein [Bacilli bacterium]|jgi:small subunit ribosomal protein S1|nr:S1 RNA-binding domain-containing protein [Bacilli bacterium]
MGSIVGDVFTGVVVHKEHGSYLLDIGIGSDVVLNKDEAERELELDDVVDVIVAYYVKDEYFVSMNGVTRRKKLEEINRLIGSEESISGKVVAFKNKRFIIDLNNGVKGSVYVKNMDTKFIEEGDEYLNNTYDFLVVERSRRGYEDFELNRRDLLNKELLAKKAIFNEKYHVDDIVHGKVIEVIKAGLIMDVDGIHCFIPYSEIAHYHNFEMPEVGSEFDVQIIETQERSLSIKASIKKLVEHPFNKVHNVNVGDVLNGKVTKVLDYGLFVELFEHVDGLVHISEVSYEHTKDLSTFEIGQEVQVKVIGIDFDKKKIALSIKKLQKSPYDSLKDKIKVGDTISVLIKRITENGIRVKVIDDFYTTIINEDIADFSKVKPTFKIKDRLEVIVMELDDDKEKILLSNTEYVKKESEIFAMEMDRTE